MAQKVGDPFYKAPKWLRFRAQMIRALRHQGCAACKRDFEPGDTIHVDHIIERLKAPHLSYEPTNMRLLHAGCHRIRHNVEHKPPVGEDGYPEGWGD